MCCVVGRNSRVLRRCALGAAAFLSVYSIQRSFAERVGSVCVRHIRGNALLTTRVTEKLSPSTFHPLKSDYPSTQPVRHWASSASILSAAASDLSACRRRLHHHRSAASSAACATS